MTPSPLITRLINEAQHSAAERIGPVMATTATLAQLAVFIRLAVIGQVLEGAWRDVGVTEYEHIAELKVTARLGKSLFNEPAIKVDFDFTKTVLMTLVVESQVVQ